MEMTERQKILRLLAKEVVVSDDTITIRHCLPIPTANSGGDGSDSSPDEDPESGTLAVCYLLRSGSSQPTASQPVHEPVPEALAADGERTAVRSGHRQLRR